MFTSIIDDDDGMKLYLSTLYYAITALIEIEHDLYEIF